MQHTQLGVSYREHMDKGCGLRQVQCHQAAVVCVMGHTYDYDIADGDHTEHEAEGAREMKNAPAYSVTLNKETYDLLQDVKNDLTAQLGFEPTNGQVVRHLAAAYFDRKEN